METGEDFGPMASVIHHKLAQLRIPCGGSEAAVGRLLSDGGEAFATLVCRLCEEVNMSTFRLGLSFLSGSSFIPALLSLLANFGNEFLWEVDEVLDTFESRTYLLDFLSSNLQLCRLERARSARRAATRDPLVAAVCELAVALRPPTILADPSGQSVQSACHELLPLCIGPLVANRSERLVASATPEFVAQIAAANQQLKPYYEMRKQASLQRLDVTVKCFEWGATAAGKRAEFAALREAVGGRIGDGATHVGVWDVLLMDREMLRVHRISARSAAHSVAREYVIGASVPDRGGRVGEGRLKMPVFKKRDEAVAEGGRPTGPKKQANYQPRANQAAAAAPGGNRGGGAAGGAGGGGKKKKSGGKKTGAWVEEKKRPNMASSAERHDTGSPKRHNADK